MRVRLLLAVLALSLLGLDAGRAQPVSSADTTAQDRRAIPYPVTPDRAFDRAVAAGTRTRSGKPGPNYWTNTAAYTLDATVDPQSNLLRGTGTIRYQNRSPDTLRRVVLHLRQDIHEQGALRNRRAEITGGMTVDRVAVPGADTLRRVRSRAELRRRGQGYALQDTRLILFLPQPLLPDDATTLELDWRFQIPGADNFRMGQDGEVYYLGYWYPQVAVYDDVDGWVAEPYQGDGEFYMGYADYDVSVTVPEGWLVGATGTLQNPADVLTDSVRARLDRARQTDAIVSVVDSSQRGVGSATQSGADGTLTWRFSADTVRDFAFGTAAPFVWDATTAEVGDSTSMVHAFYRPERSAWARSAEYAQFSIEHLSGLMGPYPYPQMTTVEGPLDGGMEYPMITLIGSGRGPEALFGTTYHEISHMWVPMLVGTNEKRYAWLDEGPTSFNTSVGEGDFYDKDPWAESAHYYYRFAPSVETPSMRHADQYPTGTADRLVASYDKPAVMLHALRAILGPDLFLEAYQAYVERWTNKHPTPHDFFNTFEDVADRELDWFWRGAFYETWTMDHAVASVDRADDAVVVTVADRDQLPMPVLLEATYADGRTVERRVGVDPWLAGRRTVDVSLPAGSVTRIELDPDNVLPDLNRDNNVWTTGE